MTKRLPCLLACLLLFSFIIGLVSAAEDKDLDFRWRYALDGDVKAMAAGDLDGDGVEELVAASPDKVYVFNATGGVKKTVDLGFVPTMLSLSDVDLDGRKEIVLGSGYITKTNLTVNRFNFTDLEDLKEVGLIIHEITRNRGEVYVIQEGSYVPELFINVGEWVKAFVMTDVGSDGNMDFVILSGGMNMDHIERSVKEPSPPRVIDHYKIGTDEDACGSVTARNENASIQCMFFRVPSTDKYYYIGRFWDGYMDINETLPPIFPERYVRNITYEYLYNHTVSIYSFERGLSGFYRSNDTFLDMEVGQYILSKPPVIMTGEEDVLLIDSNASLNRSLKPPQANYSIRWIESAGLDKDTYNNIVVGFLGPGMNGAYALDDEGSLYWTFRDVSKNLDGLFVYDLDGDEYNDVVVVLDKKAYVLNNTGGIKWTNTFAEQIDRMQLSDFEGDGLVEFVLGSGRAVIVYGISEEFIRMRMADAQYKRASELYYQAKYDEAAGLLQKARAAYLSASSYDLVSRCDELMGEIEKGKNAAKKDAAASLYKKGRSDFFLGDYNMSRESIETARTIYLSIGDDENVVRCDEALREIEDALKALEATTTTQTTTTSTTTTTVPEPEYDLSSLPLYLSLAALVGLALVWMSYSGKRRKMKANDKQEYGAEGRKPLEKM